MKIGQEILNGTFDIIKRSEIDCDKIAMSDALRVVASDSVDQIIYVLEKEFILDLSTKKMFIQRLIVNLIQAQDQLT
jgi:hypothetical protein